LVAEIPPDAANKVSYYNCDYDQSKYFVNIQKEILLDDFVLSGRAAHK